MPSAVNTPQGKVALLPPTRELLLSIRDLLPMGIMGLEPPKDGAAFGIVMQCGKDEVWAVKQQPVECSQEKSRITHKANSILIAVALKRYQARGFGGLFIPCPYMRDKGAEGVEAGIAYFGFPRPDGREVVEYDANPAFDDGFGRGFTAMMTGFIQDLQATSAETGIGIAPTIGLDPRPRSQLGGVGFAFMAVGPHIVCLKRRVTEKDPSWTALRSTGIDRVYHMPSLPISVSEEQLRITKPNSSHPEN